MADKRKRIYYTKGQITKGLVTNGGQWMTTDNVEYIGQYHTYTTGEVFTDASYINNKSRILIPYVDIETVSELDIDFSKNFEYDTISNVNINRSASPNPVSQLPTNKDILRGYMIRNFAVKVTDGEVIELTTKDIQQIGSENGLDKNLYRTFNLRWKITGPTNDVLDSQGNIIESGIVQTNQRTLNLKAQKYPKIKEYIPNLLQFSQGIAQTDTTAVSTTPTPNTPTTPTTTPTTPSTTPSTGTTSGGSTSVGGGGTSTSGGGTSTSAGGY